MKMSKFAAFAFVASVFSTTTFAADPNEKLSVVGDLKFTRTVPLICGAKFNDDAGGIRFNNATSGQSTAWVEIASNNGSGDVEVTLSTSTDSSLSNDVTYVVSGGSGSETVQTNGNPFTLTKAQLSYAGGPTFFVVPHVNKELTDVPNGVYEINTLVNIKCLPNVNE